MTFQEWHTSYTIPICIKKSWRGDMVCMHTSECLSFFCIRCPYPLALAPSTTFSITLVIHFLLHTATATTTTNPSKSFMSHFETLTLIHLLHTSSTSWMEFHINMHCWLSSNELHLRKMSISKCHRTVYRIVSYRSVSFCVLGHHKACRVVSCNVCWVCLSSCVFVLYDIGCHSSKVRAKLMESTTGCNNVISLLDCVYDCASFVYCVRACLNNLYSLHACIRNKMHICSTAQHSTAHINNANDGFYDTNNIINIVVVIVVALLMRPSFVLLKYIHKCECFWRGQRRRTFMKNAWLECTHTYKCV